MIIVTTSWGWYMLLVQESNSLSTEPPSEGWPSYLARPRGPAPATGSHGEVCSKVLFGVLGTLTDYSVLGLRREGRESEMEIRCVIADNIPRMAAIRKYDSTRVRLSRKT